MGGQVSSDRPGEDARVAEGEPGPLVEGHIREQHVRAIRQGHGANCSSIGSVVDTLFASAVVGGAVFAAIVAAMKRERVRVVGDHGPPPSAPTDSTKPSEAVRDA